MNLFRVVSNIEFHFDKVSDCSCFVLGAICTVACDKAFILLNIDFSFLTNVWLIQKFVHPELTSAVTLNCSIVSIVESQALMSSY